MNLCICFVVLALWLPNAFAGELAGTWEGRLQTTANSSYAGFDFDVAAGKVSGEAFVEGWGYSIIGDGRIEGDHFRFTVDRKYAGTGPVTKVQFEGTVNAKSMKLTMIDGERREATLHRVETQVTEPISMDALPKDLEGAWTAHFVGRIGERPKMIGRIDLDLKVTGDTITGMAHMLPGWPGDCPISEGKLLNGRFSFTATGRVPSSTGLPILWFEGEIHGQQLKLTLHHQLFGTDNKKRLPMDAVRR